MTTLRIDDLIDYTTFLPGGELSMDLMGALISGPRVVQEHVVRAWVAEPGSLPWARDRGLGILRWVNLSVTAFDLENRRSSLIAHALSVDYVADCTVALSVASRRMLIDAGLTLIDGQSYALAVRVDEAAQVIARFT